MILAFDTSNYTTSVAYLDRDSHRSCRKLLDVPSGGLGLRQSEALFQHIKALPTLLEDLTQNQPLPPLQALGVSTRPREQEGSYMPCFLAGESQARSMATALGLPCYPVSHQQGHLAAATWSIGRLDLLDSPFLAWHLSGGTTELLHVVPQGKNVVAEVVGGTTDISAGQLLDRSGQRLGLDFPGGKLLDRMALDCDQPLPPFPIKARGLHCSLSGMENQVMNRLDQGASPQAVAAFVLDSLGNILVKISQEAEKIYHLPLLFCGGVASSQYLAPRLKALGLVSKPEYSSDNALGVAVLAQRIHRAGPG